MGIFDATSRFLEQAKKKVQPVVQAVKNFNKPITAQGIGNRQPFINPIPKSDIVKPTPIIRPVPARPAAVPVARKPTQAAPGLASAAQRLLGGAVNTAKKFVGIQSPFTPMGVTPNIAEKVGQALRKTPDVPIRAPSFLNRQKILPILGEKSPSLGQAFDFAKNIPSQIARDTGFFLEKSATPQGRKQLFTGAKQIPTQIRNKDVGALFENPAIIALSGASNIIPGGGIVPSIAKKGIKQAVVKAGAKEVTKKEAPQLFKGTKPLQSLAEEARRVPDEIPRLVNIAKQTKNPKDFAETFARMRNVLIAEKGKAGIWEEPSHFNRLFSTEETTRELTKRLQQKGFKSIEDFYTQATGGVKPTLFGKTSVVRQPARIAKEVEPTAQQIADAEDQILREVQAEMRAVNQADPNQKLFTKMRNFLRISGEKRPESTGELYREHIPAYVFGQSSDELATSMGMTENELMAKLTEGITVGGRVTAQKINISRLQKKAKDLFEKLDPQSYKVMRDVFNKVEAVSAEATPQTLAKVAKQQARVAEQAAKEEYNTWKTNMFKQEARTTGEAVEDIVSEIDRATVSPLSKGVEELKDIGNVAKGFRDVFRNFSHVFGKKVVDAKRLILDPFDEAKGVFVKNLNQWENAIEQNVIKNGIKKGNRESELTQLFGERQMSLAELQAKAPKKWQAIVEADRWFRQAYDNLLNEVNSVRARIYPNDPTKIIPRRADYYRHFREMAQGIEGLRNVFDTPANITSHLSGISEFTKPKSKFLSFAQKRLGLRTDVDAVGGFIDYVRAAEYAKNIDPHIGKFRALAKELAEQTAEGVNAGRLNNFIEYLQDFANDLAGKTNPIDRALQKYIPGGRQAFRIITWANSRVKANVMLGNISSSLAQIFNVPQGMANVGNPKYWYKGAGDSLASMFAKNAPMEKSTFIAERYNRAFEKFNTGLLDNPKRFTIWMITVLDEVGTKYIWNMHYQKAIAEGVGNPIKYADDITRGMVAGRSIGEVPLAQKARLSQMIIPFQIEVGNLWWVMKDMVDEKTFGKLATLFVLNHVFNKAAEAIRGSGVTLDPIQAMLDSFETFAEEEDKGVGAIRAVGRLAGEVLSNVPFGQTAAQLYPEYGVKIPGTEETLTRKEFFGREDPTRFGGGPLFAKGLTDPLFKLLPPFGGVQAQRTIEGSKALNRGYSETKTGRVRFPIEPTPRNIGQGALFGQYALPEGQTYFRENRQPLGDQQSEAFKATSPNERRGVYEGILETREAERKKTKQKETDTERLMPIYEQLEALDEADRWQEAEDIYQSLPEEDKEIYRSIKQSEKTKAGNILEKQMYSIVKQFQELDDQGRWDEAEQIYQDMTPEEKRAYKAAKKALGIGKETQQVFAQ